MKLQLFWSSIAGRGAYDHVLQPFFWGGRGRICSYAAECPGQSASRAARFWECEECRNQKDRLRTLSRCRPWHLPSQEPVWTCISPKPDAVLNFIWKTVCFNYRSVSHELSRSFADTFWRVIATYTAGEEHRSLSTNRILWSFLLSLRPFKVKSGNNTARTVIRSRWNPTQEGRCWIILAVVLRSEAHYIHCVSKNDTDVAHYNFNSHHPILVIF